jgi:hypothetical protein
LAQQRQVIGDAKIGWRRAAALALVAAVDADRRFDLSIDMFSGSLSSILHRLMVPIPAPL